MWPFLSRSFHSLLPSVPRSAVMQRRAPFSDGWSHAVTCAVVHTQDSQGPVPEHAPAAMVFRCGAHLPSKQIEGAHSRGERGLDGGCRIKNSILEHDNHGLRAVLNQNCVCNWGLDDSW